MRYLLILMMIIPFGGMTEGIDTKLELRQQPFYWTLWEPIATDGDTFEYEGYDVTHYIGPHTKMDLERRSGLLHLLFDFDEPVTEYAQSYEYFISYDCFEPETDTIINRLTWDGPKGTAKSGSDAYASSLNVTWGDVKDDERFGVIRKLVGTFCLREHNLLATEYTKLARELKDRTMAKLYPEREHLRKHPSEYQCGPYEMPCDEPRHRIYGSNHERLVRENLDAAKKAYERHPDLYEKFLKLLDSSGIR